MVREIKSSIVKFNLLMLIVCTATACNEGGGEDLASNNSTSASTQSKGAPGAKGDRGEKGDKGDRGDASLFVISAPNFFSPRSLGQSWTNPSTKYIQVMGTVQLINNGETTVNTLGELRSTFSELATEISLQRFGLGVNDGAIYNANRAAINIPVNFILAPGGSFRLIQMEDVNSNAVLALGQWYYHTLN